MAKGKITAKQQEILEYMKEEILKKGYPPTRLPSKYYESSGVLTVAFRHCPPLCPDQPVFPA